MTMAITYDLGTLVDTTPTRTTAARQTTKPRRIKMTLKGIQLSIVTTGSSTAMGSLLALDFFPFNASSSPTVFALCAEDILPFSSSS